MDLTVQQTFWPEENGHMYLSMISRLQLVRRESSGHGVAESGCSGCRGNRGRVHGARQDIETVGVSLLQRAQKAYVR